VGLYYHIVCNFNVIKRLYIIFHCSESDGRSSQSNRRQSVLHLEPTRSHVTTSGVRRRMINTAVDIENAANSLDVAEMWVCWIIIMAINQ